MRKSKLPAFFLALVLTWTLMPGAFASGPVISVQSVSGAVGDTVDVPVSISGNLGVSALVLRLGFDSDYLEPVAVTKTDLLQGGLFVDNLSAERQPLTSVNMTWANTEDITGDGLLYTISFRIIRKLPGGVTSLEWDTQSSNVSNENLQLVGCVFQDGEVASDTMSLFPWLVLVLALLLLSVCIYFYRKAKRKRILMKESINSEKTFN